MIKDKIKYFMLLSLVFLAGCATAPTWYKDGATQASFDADKAECEYEAIKYAGNSGVSVGQAYAAAMQRQDIVLACLRQKGYSTEPPKFKPIPFLPLEKGKY